MPCLYQHPAPLPQTPPSFSLPGMKAKPPKTQLKGRKLHDNKLLLVWRLPPTPEEIETIVLYQLYTYLEDEKPPSIGHWKKMATIRAPNVPMGAKIEPLATGVRQHFAVRAVDRYKRKGPFSNYVSFDL